MNRWSLGLLLLVACEPVEGQVRLGGEALDAQACSFDRRGDAAVVDFELRRPDRLRLVQVDRLRFLVLFVDERGRAVEEYGDCAVGLIDEDRLDGERETVDVEVDFDCRSRIPELVGRWRARTCDA